MAFKIARFLGIADGLQANQFSIGSRDTLDSLDDSDPIYKPLLDGPVPAIYTVMGSDGRANMTPSPTTSTQTAMFSSTRYRYWMGQ